MKRRLGNEMVLVVGAVDPIELGSAMAKHRVVVKEEL